MKFSKVGKVAGVTLATVAAFGILTACGSSNARGGSASSSSSTTLKKGDLIGISMPTKADQRWNVDGANLVKDLQKAGYKAKLLYANNSTAQQSNDINNLVSAGAKAVVVAAVDGTAVGPAVQQAEQQGDTVIAYDRLIMNTKAVNYYVTFNLEQTGIYEANDIINKLNLKNGGGERSSLQYRAFRWFG